MPSFPTRPFSIDQAALTDTRTVARDAVIVRGPVRDLDGSRMTFTVDGLLWPELWYAVEPGYADFLSNRCDAAVVGLLAAAMYAGKDLHIEGEVSAKLLFAVNRYVVPLVLEALIGTHRIRVTADSTVAAPAIADAAVVTGLSNGVDSLAVAFDYLLAPSVPDSLRITHFLYNSIGSHGADANPASMEIFEKRAPRVKRSAEALGRPVVFNTSNLDRFYTNPFYRTSSLRNASVGLALGGRVGHFLYGSTHRYGAIEVSLQDDLAYVEPILMPQLSTESLECRSAVAGRSRTEKIALICDMPVAQENLDVCLTEFPNCSVCRKCARTLLALEAMGKIDKFETVFNLQAYRKARAGFISHIFNPGMVNPLGPELAAYLRQVGFRITPRQKVRNAIARPLHSLAATIPSWKARRVYQRYTGQWPNE